MVIKTLKLETKKRVIVWVDWDKAEGGVDICFRHKAARAYTDQTVNCIVKSSVMNRSKGFVNEIIH